MSEEAVGIRDKVRRGGAGIPHGICEALRGDSRGESVGRGNESSVDSMPEFESVLRLACGFLLQLSAKP